MKRRIIKIDEERCNGCGLCAAACHEGAICMVNGKAKLMRDDFCDGLGDCLPSCPVSAISFEERDALPYDEAAVKKRMSAAVCTDTVRSSTPCVAKSELQQWPIQLQLMPMQSSVYHDADLLIAADCCAYVYPDFHKDFMKQHVTVICCPKLDQVQYREKLCAIMKLNTIRSIQVVRMEVPCCKGIERAALDARTASGKKIPIEIVTLSRSGERI